MGRDANRRHLLILHSPQRAANGPRHVEKKVKQSHACIRDHRPYRDEIWMRRIATHDEQVEARLMPKLTAPVRQRSLKTIPTLPGLRIVERPHNFLDEVVPWTRTGPFEAGGVLSPGRWLVYDEEDNVVQLDRRTLVLEVPGLRAACLANKLHCRAMRRAWRAGTYTHTASFAPRSRFPWPLLLVGAAIMLVLGLWCMRGGPWTGEPDALMTALQRLLVHGLAIAWLLMLTGPFLLLAWIARSYSQRPNVIEARFDAEGLSARLMDGTEPRVPWGKMLKTRQLGGLAELRFTDRTVLWLRIEPLDRRTRLVLRLAAHPNASDAELLGHEMPTDVLCRCLLYCLIGALGGFALTWVWDPEERHLVWVPSLFLLAAGLVLMLPSHLPRWLGRLERRRRNHRRRVRRAG